MLGRKLRKKSEGKGPDKIELLIMKMDAALEAGHFDKLEDLMKELQAEIDLRLKGGFYPPEEWKKLQRALKYLEEKAKAKKEELSREESKMKKLKSYGEFG